MQSGGQPLRVFHAVDPRRSAILLIGGDERFYDRMIPVADDLYDEHLAELEGARRWPVGIPSRRFAPV